MRNIFFDYWGNAWEAIVGETDADDDTVQEFGPTGGARRQPGVFPSGWGITQRARAEYQGARMDTDENGWTWVNPEDVFAEHRSLEDSERFAS